MSRHSQHPAQAPPDCDHLSYFDYHHLHFLGQADPPAGQHDYPGLPSSDLHSLDFSLVAPIDHADRLGHSRFQLLIELNDHCLGSMLQHSTSRLGLHAKNSPHQVHLFACFPRYPYLIFTLAHSYFTFHLNRTELAATDWKNLLYHRSSAQRFLSNLHHQQARC